MYLTARLLGHSGRSIYGHEPVAGREHAAEMIDHATGDDVDRIDVELIDCYPSAADTSSLRWPIALDHTAEQVTVRDATAFEGSAADPELESVFVSYALVRKTVAGVKIEGTGPGRVSRSTRRRTASKSSGSATPSTLPPAIGTTPTRATSGGCGSLRRSMWTERPNSG